MNSSRMASMESTFGQSVAYMIWNKLSYITEEALPLLQQTHEYHIAMHAHTYTNHILLTGQNTLLNEFSRVRSLLDLVFQCILQ